MRRWYTALVIISMFGLPACLGDQLSKFAASAARVEPALEAACSTASALATVAGLVPGVGAILPYIKVGCGTPEGLARLAADPSSTEWVDQLIGTIKTLGGRVGMKL